MLVVPFLFHDIFGGRDIRSYTSRFGLDGKQVNSRRQGRRYGFEATATANNRRYVFKDSVFVDQDRSENSVNGQNVTLLQEIAQPLPEITLQSIETLLFNANPGTGRPEKKQFKVNRNWTLLVLAFILFAGEWILRRRLRLE